MDRNLGANGNRKGKTYPSPPCSKERWAFRCVEKIPVTVPIRPLPLLHLPARLVKPGMNRQSFNLHQSGLQHRLDLPSEKPFAGPRIGCRRLSVLGELQGNRKFIHSSPIRKPNRQKGTWRYSLKRPPGTLTIPTSCFPAINSSNFISLDRGQQNAKLTDVEYANHWYPLARIQADDFGMLGSVESDVFRQWAVAGMLYGGYSEQERSTHNADNDYC